MRKNQLRALLKRAESWSKGAQQEAVQVLREIEGDLFAGPVTMAELDRAHQETLRDKGISLEYFGQRLDA